MLHEAWHDTWHKTCYMTKPFRHTKRFIRFEFITKVLIFRSSRSQMFIKIGVLKNFTVLEPLYNKVAGVLLQNTYGVCFWNFAAADTFSQLNLAFIANSYTGFCSRLLWKHELNLRTSHWSCSVKKVFLEISLISQENTFVEVSF